MPNVDLRKRVISKLDTWKIPLAGYFIDRAIELPGPTVKRTAQHLRALSVIIAKLPATV